MFITLFIISFVITFWIGYFIARYKINKAAESMWRMEMEKQRLMKLASMYGCGTHKDGDSA